MELDELTRWILVVDRRILVMRTIHERGLIKASEIAGITGRSQQNISRALRELETMELIECLTPDKHTWKRFILTEKGIEVFEKLKKYYFID
jgi:DNA-binding MarR family transcriptional regulator